MNVKAAVMPFSRNNEGYKNKTTKIIEKLRSKRHFGNGEIANQQSTNALAENK